LNRSDMGQELEQEGDEIRRNGMFSCPPILLFSLSLGGCRSHQELEQERHGIRRNRIFSWPPSPVLVLLGLIVRSNGC